MFDVLLFKNGSEEKSWKKKYAREILRKFHMENYKSKSTLMNQKKKFNKDDGIERVAKGYYKRLIRCLMYLTARGEQRNRKTD